MYKLHPGELFPHLSADSIPHGRIELPAAVRTGRYAVVLVYRAHWCGYSRHQLLDFQNHLPELEAAGGELFALSTDTFQNAKKTVELLSLSFPVLYGLDGAKTAHALGAYYETMRQVMQPAHFVLGLDHTLAHVLVSSGPMGFVGADDSVRYIKDVREHGVHVANIGRDHPQ
jgi:peroxiredoxin